MKFKPKNQTVNAFQYDSSKMLMSDIKNLAAKDGDWVVDAGGNHFFVMNREDFEKIYESIDREINTFDMRGA